MKVVPLHVIVRIQPIAVAVNLIITGIVVGDAQLAQVHAFVKMKLIVVDVQVMHI